MARADQLIFSLSAVLILGVHICKISLTNKAETKWLKGGEYAYFEDLWFDRKNFYRASAGNVSKYVNGLKT